MLHYVTIKIFSLFLGIFRNFTHILIASNITNPIYRDTVIKEATIKKLMERIRLC
jgi:hypothetical protein